MYLTHDIIQILLDISKIHLLFDKLRDSFYINLEKFPSYGNHHFKHVATQLQAKC